MNEIIATGYANATRIKDYKSPQKHEGLVIIPERIDAVDGTGYYSEEAPSTYKELVALGYEPHYATQKQVSIQRRSGGEFDLIQISIGLVSGVISSALYDGIKLWIKHKANKKVNPSVKGKIYIENKSGKQWSWQEYEISGNVDSAIKMIDTIRKSHTSDASAGTKNTK